MASVGFRAFSALAVGKWIAVCFGPSGTALFGQMMNLYATYANIPNDGLSRAMVKEGAHAHQQGDEEGTEEAVHKLNLHWGYTGNLDSTIPRWIMREWCSFWLNDMFDQTYNLKEYNKINSTVKISTQDFFENWIETFYELALALKLFVTIDIDTIKKQHEQFLKLQKFHNIQLRCEQYVNDLINGVDSNITLHSIFDEAYIQQLLRQHDILIRCHELDIFPSTTQDLKNLIYASK
jgi:hypothetical protein